MTDFEDTTLENALRSLTAAIDWPTATPAGAPDIATRVRARLVSMPKSRPTTRPWWLPRARPFRRSVVLALAALLALAVAAGAVGLGLPGLRIILGDPPGSPAPTVDAPQSPRAGRPGQNLGLGRAVTIADARVATGRPLPLPIDPSLAPPDAIYLDTVRADQVAFVWAARPGLPDSVEPGVGLILMSFDGRFEEALLTKFIGPGTSLERVRVGSHPAFWIEGDPHAFFYRNDMDGIIADERRWVGDALIWSDGTITYRIESALGRDASIALAESLE